MSGANETQREARSMWRTLVFSLLLVGIAYWCLRVPSCGWRDSGENLGKVQYDELTEISGIAMSRQYDGVLWAHNDSGDSARVFAMKTDGTHLGVFSLEDVRAVDWEDMAIGAGPKEGVDYLYIADTGNNLLDRPSGVIYRVPEPAITNDGSPREDTLDQVETLPVSFPNGPYECETLMVDPMTGDLYLVSRDRDAGKEGVSMVFRYPAPQKPGEAVTLELVTRLLAPIEIKGGDISPDGSQILLRAHSMQRPVKCLLWQWDREKTLGEVLREDPEEVPAAFEAQGEAISFSADGQSYFTVGEGFEVSIHRYELPSR